MDNEAFLKQLGAKITAERKKRRLSRNKLSRLCDMDLTNLAIIEKGQRGTRVLTLKGIAEALNMELRDFL